MDKTKDNIKYFFNKLPASNGETAYERLKKLKFKGCKSYKDAVVCPIYDENEEIQSFQAISPDKKKMFMKGAPLASGRFLVNPDYMGSWAHDHVFLCEGVATAFALSKLCHDSVPIVCCYSATNMKSLYKEYESLELIPHMLADVGVFFSGYRAFLLFGKNNKDWWDVWADQEEQYKKMLCSYLEQCKIW